MKKRKQSGQFIITAKNMLTGKREAISRPMGEQAASERLTQEVAARKGKSHLPHTRLKVERVQPKQLKLQFTD